ncbi:MAG: hypothetical protein GF329_10535 [Candidatus Lokiarchaeota archaeon]|nr:hypothetical protein [Candidatus Lokiarchaeota archaeon]
MEREEEHDDGEQISVIVFEVDQEQFAIDLLDVKEIIQTAQIRRLPRSLDFIEGIFNYRGNIIHIINLKRKLKLENYKLYPSEEAMIEEDSSKKFIIIVNVEDTDIGFYVDKVINVRRVGLRKLVALGPIVQTNIENVDYIKGVIKFEDKPRIFIDLQKILSESEQLLIQNNQ